MGDKRGLSEIVATLIIILLTLVAVGIVWVVVQNLIRSGAEQAELGTYTLDLEIKSVQIEGEYVTVVVVKRNPGEGEFVGINFIFSNGTDSEIIRENTTLNELDTKSFRLFLINMDTSTLTSVSVVPIYKTSSGKESAGGVADEFDISANKSMGTDDIITGNFASLGFSGMGKVDYTFFGHTPSPEFKHVIIDPLDVRVGDVQTFTAIVYSPNGIVNVTTITQLDNDTLNLPLQRISGSAGSDETWSANWTVYDTHLTTYNTLFIATDSLGNKNNVSLTWTDSEPCFSLADQGDDKTISIACSIGVGEVAGLDTGDITISAVIQMTGGTFVWTDGYSVTFSGSGQIATSGTVMGTQGYLYYTDADSDGYGAGTSMVYSSSETWAGHTRARDTTGTSDCADTAGNQYVWLQATGTNVDVDHDGYEAGSSQGGGRCMGDMTTMSGRRYYNSPNNNYEYVVWADQLGSNDCNDASAPVYVQKTCYPDSDWDSYTSGSSSICTNSGCTVPSLYRNAANGDDCNDGSASLWQTLTCYTDSDGDSVGAGGSSGICSGSSCPSGYSSVGTDCDDGNINVWYNGYGYDDDGDGYGNETPAGCYNGNAPYNAQNGYDWCPGSPLDWTDPCE